MRRSEAAVGGAIRLSTVTVHDLIRPILHFIPRWPILEPQ